MRPQWKQMRFEERERLEGGDNMKNSIEEEENKMKEEREEKKHETQKENKNKKQKI